MLIEGLALEEADKLCLTPHDVLHVNPCLIHLSITGFGKTGPKARLHWKDPVLAALGGQMHVVGPKSGPPRWLAGGQSFYSSSLFGAVAILLALHGRKLTVKGRHTDLSMREAVASTLDHVMTDFFQDGTICRRDGSVYGNGSFTFLPNADGQALLTVLLNWTTLLDDRLRRKGGRPHREGMVRPDISRNAPRSCFGHPGALDQRLHKRRAILSRPGHAVSLGAGVHSGGGPRKSPTRCPHVFRPLRSQRERILLSVGRSPLQIPFFLASCTPDGAAAGRTHQANY